MKNKWFSVKTIYKTYPIGKPKATDKHYDDSIVMIEERIVLFYVKDARRAIRMAEIEAKKYAEEVDYKNQYGQQVKQVYMGACDCFELAGSPANQVEVFSSTEIVSKKASRGALIDKKFGVNENLHLLNKRKIFLSEEFCGKIY